MFVGLEVAHSSEVPKSYEAEVPVSDKGEQTRDKAMQAALLKVMMAVSGERKLTGRALVNEALQQAERYVQQFRYRLASVDPGHVSSGNQLMFWAQFDPVSVDRILQQSGIRIWQRSRPSMLVWLIVQKDATRALLGAKDRSELSNVLYATAAERGISTILPLLDLDDRSRIDEDDVWHRVQDRVFAASERYDVDIVLVGRALASRGASSNHWEARWALLGGEMTENWTTHGNGSKEVLRKGIHEAIDILVTRNTRSRAGNVVYNPLKLTIFGMGSIGDYARVWRYLENLQSGTKVYVTEVEAKRMSFRISALFDQTRLDKMIRNGSTLSKMTTGVDDAPAYKLLSDPSEFP